MLCGDVDGKANREWKWIGLPQMVKSRLQPGLAYFNDHVFVAGGNSGWLDIECIHLLFDHTTSSQWTIISIMELTGPMKTNLVVYNEKLLLMRMWISFFSTYHSSFLLRSFFTNRVIFMS